MTEIDFQKTFKEKIGKDILRSVQLGACNPQLAFKVYSMDEQIATMLPCHVVVQEQVDGSTRVTFADPLKMFANYKEGQDVNPAMKEVAEDAHQRLRKAFESIHDIAQ